MTFDEWYEQNAKYMNTTDFEAWMLEAWEAGVKNEREACAKVCDEHGFYGEAPARNIRARGE